MKTIDEILSKYSRTDEGNGFYDKDVWEAMEEYAKSNKPKEVSDEDIEKQIVECGLSTDPSSGQQFWEGAVWMRDQLNNSNK